ncbi:hypothetical protein Baya_8534 [Bagarius yarrelli]|uniref:THD domain-containing protein n=1 Tax=Bagarius yarrelli TaxID=175774 RepID=A0A556U5X5_BAGYA|nr:hypothetical protein Baya_8534 [Bagarius yarrelli]
MFTIAGNDKSPWMWTYSSLCFCPNTSLHLQNDSVIVTTGGFYYIYAQVSFINIKAHERTVTLVANENVPGKTVRKLSEAEQVGSTVSMSAVIRLGYGESVKLNIAPESHQTMRDSSKTFWGLYLLAKQNDK